MKNNMISYLLVSLFIFLVLFDLNYRANSKPVYKSITNQVITDSFHGTFATEENPFCYITIAKASEKFYYFDDRLSLYFNGDFTNAGSDYYELSSQYFGTQTIQYKDLCFEIMLGEKLHKFEKISNQEMYKKDFQIAQ